MGKLDNDGNQPAVSALADLQTPDPLQIARGASWRSRTGGRLVLRGAAAYELSWFDAHLWTYAERYGLPELLSKDFQDDRVYGSVRVVNPFQT